MFLEQVVCSQLGIQIQTVKCKDLDNYAAGAFDLAIKTGFSAICTCTVLVLLLN